MAVKKRREKKPTNMSFFDMLQKIVKTCKMKIAAIICAIIYIKQCHFSISELQ